MLDLSDSAIADMHPNNREFAMRIRHCLETKDPIEMRKLLAVMNRRVTKMEGGVKSVIRALVEYIMECCKTWVFRF